MTDDATKRAHEAADALADQQAMQDDGTVARLHAAIDAAVKAAEERGKSVLCVKCDGPTDQHSFDLARGSVCPLPHKDRIQKVAADMRERAFYAANSDAGCEGKPYTDYERGRIDAAQDVKNLPLRGGDDGD